MWERHYCLQLVKWVFQVYWRCVICSKVGKDSIINYSMNRTRLQGGIWSHQMLVEILWFKLEVIVEAIQEEGYKLVKVAQFLVIECSTKVKKSDL
jgi:hypothetical protein